MSGKSLALIAGAVVLMGLVAAGFLFFGDDGDSGLPAPTPTPALGGPAVPEGDEAENDTGRIVTKEFSEAVEIGDEEVSISADGTGIQVWGMVEDPSGSPLAGALVDLVRDVGVIRNRAQEEDHPVGTVRTKASGTFRFTNLQPDEVYVLRVYHDDYTTKRVFPIDPQTPSTTQNVVVRLEKGLSLAGRVLDTSGQPIPGVRVSVYELSIQAMDPEGQLERWALTDADGNYEVKNLIAGTKKVIARKDGYAANGRPALTLRSEKDGRGVNLVLNSGFRITGVVLDRDSRTPVAGAMVTARPIRYLAAKSGTGGQTPPVGGEGIRRAAVRDEGESAANRRRNFGPGSILQKAYLLENVRTDEEGRFELTSLIGASYMLMVRCKGYQPNNTTHADAGAENIEVLLAPSASISGQVIDDETGQPIKSFSVAVTASPSLTSIPVKQRQRFHSEDGSFRYVDVTPGTMHVFVEAEGYAGGRMGPIPVMAGQSVTDVVVRVYRGATLKGRVVDAAGKPVKGALVEVSNTTGVSAQAQAFLRFLTQQMRQSSKRGFTDAEGRWEIPHVLEGTYSVKVTHPAFSGTEVSGVTCQNSGEVEVEEISLSPGATIKGIVRTKAGEPDAQASVMISSADPQQMFSRTCPTNHRGEFECGGLKPGTYRVMVHQREGELQILNIFMSQQNPQNLVTVAAGEVVTLEL